MDYLLLLLLLLLLRSSGAQAVENHHSADSQFRLVNGASRCTGTLELKHHGEWRPVYTYHWDIEQANVFCQHLDCGSAVSMEEVEKFSSRRPVWQIWKHCMEPDIRDCVHEHQFHSVLNVTCADSVRLLNGTSQCSGRLEVRTNQTNQRWSSVCEDDFDLQDAEVVCRELGCGAPSVLQGALYGEVQAPMWSAEFQCGGHESALLDCRSSGSVRNSCSPAEAVGLTCSELSELKLVGGASRCAGALEIKHQGAIRPGHVSSLRLNTANILCEHLNCGSRVSIGGKEGKPTPLAWTLQPECFKLGSDLGECIKFEYSRSSSNLTCSDSVRLLNGTSQCSGRLEVRTNQTNQQWSSVCEDDFDLQDAEVVCRELGCGAPSVLQGALYGEVQAPMWSAEFQCGGHESALLDCRSSGSVRNSCSPAKAVGLTCSELNELKLVGGASRCAGALEMKHLDEWRPVYISDLSIDTANIFCEHLDCGSLVSVGEKQQNLRTPSWTFKSDCIQGASDLRDCITSQNSESSTNLTCADSVRLLNGTSQCSGRLEVRTNQVNQQWSSVCEDDFDLQDAEVVCRELGCGAPSVLQGALYGEVQAPMWSAEFQCGGHESALLDCRSSGSVRNSCSPAKAVGLTCSGHNELKLVGGASRCAGTLELKHLGEWRPVYIHYMTTHRANILCEHLDCGSIVSIEEKEKNLRIPGFTVWSYCLQSRSDLKDCSISRHYEFLMNLTCADSVRLLNGTSQCSGRLEVRTNQTNQRWASVCEDDFDLQDAEVVCRELGCGAPSVLQGALYGEVQAPMWSAEFQCGGHESALLDCRSSGSVRNSCSPAKAVGLTCSDPEELRLVGGASRCAGTLEMKHLGEWRPVAVLDWYLKAAAVVCQHLDCGSAVSLQKRTAFPARPAWRLFGSCVQSKSALKDCASSTRLENVLKITCSDSVRLLNGTSQCSGRLEMRTNQVNQQWSSVCEDDFDLQDAEVVCRELGCGAPSVLQGALYGEVQAPMWSAEFQCGGHESALLDCRSSGSVRNSCSPAKAVGLTCSEPEELRLVGGASCCAGTLEMRHLGEWRPVDSFGFHPKIAATVCQRLDCGTVIFVERKKEPSIKPVWEIDDHCSLSESPLRECAMPTSAFSVIKQICSDSVRLLNGTSQCSGRLEVRTNQTNQRWSSVCEADFDLQDAEVVCRELGCGAPSVLQGALYGEVQAPMWSAEFQCGGHESALLDCRSSGSVRNSCSPAKAVGLTCSEPEELRLVGGASRCAGTLEMKHLEEWRPLKIPGWDLKTADFFCKLLSCGSAVSAKWKLMSSELPVWSISYSCFQSQSALRPCAVLHYDSSISNLSCSDLLFQPIISMSSSYVGVSEAQQQVVVGGSTFTIGCSIQPQYPGGSFQLTFTSSSTVHSATQPTVNHSAYFLYPVAEPAHQGSYRCVYHLHVYGHNFSSESRLLSLSVSVPTAFIIRWTVLPLILLLQLMTAALWFHCKTRKLQHLNKQRNMERVDFILCVGAAEGGSADVAAVQEPALAH